MALRGRARSSAAPATTKPPISNTVFTRLLCWASHDRASALRPETAHCRSLISHSRPAVSMSCASGLGGLCSWSEKYTPLTFATSGEVASHTRVSAPFSGLRDTGLRIVIPKSISTPLLRLNPVATSPGWKQFAVTPVPSRRRAIPVVSERRFLEWIGKGVPDSLHRTYSADQIAALSKLSSRTIDELVRFGLLNPRGGLFGFRDLASARQISNLFAHGIGLSEIIRSVKEVRAWLPEADLSNLRLHPAVHHAIEIEQSGGRTDKRGQFVLPVSPPAQNADALFEQAQAAEEAEDFAEAERLYRVLMKCDPTDAAPPFNLSNMLRANGRKVEAQAALHVATRADPTFAEAWYNLSDLLDEQGRPEAAIECLRNALRAAPAYTDAMFNLALLLQRNNKHEEAAEYWRRYLANDVQSEWAARARRSLKFCEMQIHLSAS
jgi:tetratricopeptide (TPR) repeat protein